MSEHTPSLDEARAIYTSGTPAHHVTIGGAYAEFDRMIAKVRAEAKAEALREAADAMGDSELINHWEDSDVTCDATASEATQDWLRARADKLVTE